MNKDNILYGIIGLLAGLIIGYIVTDRINTSASVNATPAASAGSVPAPGGTLPADHPPTGDAAAASAGTSASSAGGVKWTPPARWQIKPGDGMRLVTYVVPGTGGGGDAECPVFYFGPGDGGGVQQNIDRWIGQFKQPDGNPSAQAARQKVETINGFPVTTVDVTGVFSGGPMASGSGDKGGYRLLGAIVQGPQSSVFFKLIGPAATVTAAQSEFQALLRSLTVAS